MVEELPVFLNRTSSGGLSCLQFPLRPRNKPYGSASDGLHAAHAARLKPRSSILELEHQLKIGGGDYDVENTVFPTESMVLRSRNVAQRTHYAIGFLDPEGSLHLAAVNGIMALTPHFQHVDAVVEREARLELTEEEEAREKERGAELKRVTLKAKRVQQQVSKEVYSKRLEEINVEPWIQLQIHENMSEASERVVAELLRHPEGQIPFDVPKVEYLNQIFHSE